MNQLVASTQPNQPQPVNRLPRATYRLQLRRDFGFDQIRQQLDYLQALGISDLYLSPLFHARVDSPHGYDVVDHNCIEPAFGDREQLASLAQAASKRGMGLLLDIVPNHMGINDPDNLLWNEVLENGPAARSAGFFDIDWDPPGGELTNCVLLPFLGKPFGETLEAGELKIASHGGGFVLQYFDSRLPLTPASWTGVLQLATESLPADANEGVRDEVASIITQLSHLSHSDQPDERYREQRIARQRLGQLLKASPALTKAVDAAVDQVNGTVGDPCSFNALERLLGQQYYRLAYWQVAVDEINYRRFFDINDLAAVRVENDVVFEHLHRLTWELVRSGIVTGLRVDHVDGLLDPTAYFEKLQSSYRNITGDREDRKLYIVVEKILSGDETLPLHWKVSGTTGYELMNAVTRVLVDGAGLERLRSAYASQAEQTEKPRDVGYHGKISILRDAMASELYVLASRLFRIARMNRRTLHFTLRGLLHAVREVIACFPVYRSYVRPQGWDVNVDDHRRIREAIRWSIVRNPTMPQSLFEFISSVLLLEFPPGLEEDQQLKWRDWVLRFQQVTGPVTAKGMEDTSFYRYYPLLSLNEVGGELGAEALPVEAFHRAMSRRAHGWPCGLSATATHDTKRGEDTRARLHVLSECPDEFSSAFRAWEKATNSADSQISAVAANEKYFIFQTLLGTWPIANSDWTHYRDRLQAYFQKAFREAKQKTSWRSPNTEFEAAVTDFVDRSIVDRESEAFKHLDHLARLIAGPGFVNSLAQVILKITLPGVPDFYQGSELWDFHLVDPDNRQPVDFELRHDVLQQTQSFGLGNAAGQAGLNCELADFRLKMFVTLRGLQARRDKWDVFARGAYRPLTVSGMKAEHVIAFERSTAEQSVVVVVPRRPFGLLDGKTHREELASYLGAAWGDTAIEVSTDAPLGWRDLLTNREIEARAGRIPVAEVFGELCGAILSRMPAVT